MENKVVIKTLVKAKVDKVWECWTSPEHIIHWNFASEDWCCPSAINKLEPGGSFSWRMEAKDGSMGFDYSGTYDKIITHSLIVKSLDDGRGVSISFNESEGITEIEEAFQPETINDPELQ